VSVNSKRKIAREIWPTSRSVYHSSAHRSAPGLPRHKFKRTRKETRFHSRTCATDSRVESCRISATRCTNIYSGRSRPGITSGLDHVTQSAMNPEKNVFRRRRARRRAYLMWPTSLALSHVATMSSNRRYSLQRARSIGGIDSRDRLNSRLWKIRHQAARSRKFVCRGPIRASFIIICGFSAHLPGLSILNTAYSDADKHRTCLVIFGLRAKGGRDVSLTVNDQGSRIRRTVNRSARRSRLDGEASRTR